MRVFRPYNPDQLYLLPPCINDWLPEDHLALFISDVVDHCLDLSEVFAPYEKGDGRGQPPYNPAMMVKLLFYAYCTGKPSSRKIEKATWEDVAYRVLSADQHPDHDSVADFRKRHLKALARLFKQILLLAEEAGLVKLGHVALDGTKIKANASKHKAMSYDRMIENEQRLEKEIKELLAAAQAVDEEEDTKYGKGKKADELPEELKRRESRLKKIREAKAALEETARLKAEVEAQEIRRKIAAQEQDKDNRKPPKSRPPHIPDPEPTKPEPKAQRNFTDPESRIMLDGASKSFEQCYNAQAAVDRHAQIIVAAEITQEANDKKQLIPMMQRVEENNGRLPARTLADAGYFSEANLSAEALEFTDLYIPPDRQKHGKQKGKMAVGRQPQDISIADKMRRKLNTKKGKKEYALRKSIVEPVFGQIKEARGFRRFSFRGLTNVAAEWDIVCLTHNLLKIFRSGWTVAPTSG